jgi:hypothetical protein
MANNIGLRRPLLHRKISDCAFHAREAAPVAKSENGSKTVVFSLATVVLSCENVVAANKPTSRTRKMKHSKTSSPTEKATAFAPSLYRIGDVVALLQVSHATIYCMVAKGNSIW